MNSDAYHLSSYWRACTICPCQQSFSSFEINLVWYSLDIWAKKNLILLNPRLCQALYIVSRCYVTNYCRYWYFMVKGIKFVAFTLVLLNRKYIKKSQILYQSISFHYICCLRHTSKGFIAPVRAYHIWRSCSLRMVWACFLRSVLISSRYLGTSHASIDSRPVHKLVSSMVSFFSSLSDSFIMLEHLSMSNCLTRPKYS